ncbi:MAG: hypothetical protein CBARDCOR_4137 [uncultured Caballeronia sp.]|nr:MAG: hypothetical protein CBARDCOR_4137 [uncultured Caballeronia sp.]
MHPLLGLLSLSVIAQESQQLSADELRAHITGSTMGWLLGPGRSLLMALTV